MKKIITILSLIGLVVIALLIKFNTYTQYYFIQNNKIQYQFSKIKSAEKNLNYDVLITSIYMYENNDKLDKDIKNLQKALKALLQNRYFEKDYPQIYKIMQKYKKMVDSKVNEIYEFQMLNSAIKNSTMYLASLLNRLQYIKNVPQTYEKKVVNTVSNIFLAKSSFDSDMLAGVDVKYFEGFKTENKDLLEYNKIFTAHLKVFTRYYDKYTKVIKNITSANNLRYLNDVYQKYFNKMNSKVVIIKRVSYLLIAFVGISIAIIIWLLIRIKKENIKLDELNKELQISYITDALTGLYNRNKFDTDIEKFQKPALLLVNIDKFKHINDYYGNKIGDLVLVEVAKHLKEIIKDSYAEVYRLGADDFGVLIEYDKNPFVRILAKKIVKYFEEKVISVEDVTLNVSVSIGISLEKPLLENADIALKHVKSSYRKKVITYNPKMDTKEEIKQNIEKSKVLYTAIKEGRIEPYFQPIVDTQTKKIVKYEILARLIHKNGHIESIYPYLQIAKDNKLYADITKTVLRKTHEKVLKKDVDININVSVEDILDKEIIREIYHLYLRNSSLSSRVTFEILESEAVVDYREIKKFLNKVKQQGAKIAIDDFGSGYSNFEHLVNLNIDYLKFDGSLIKQLPTNENAYKIIKMINEFAKDLGIQTVAEFVASEDIYNKVRELNVDFCQGYYFHEPYPYCKKD